MPSKPTRADAQRPNIVLILADDMGYGDFSANNGGLSRTPVLDSLLGQGVSLSQQYSASPVCNPSRATLLTGRYPHRTGSIDTLEWRGLERLALREITLADVLKSAGYATGLVGKWHLGAFDRRYHPNARGFDEAVCFCGAMHDYYRWRLEYNDSVRRADGRYLTDVFTDEAVQFIERHAHDPFFLHLTYNAPHLPLQAPEEEILPFAETGKFSQGVSIIYAMLHRMDSGIGRILETLHRYGLEDNTIVVFTSDNGPQFGGEGDKCTTRYNCQLHGCKGLVYEGGIRVPAIIRWPAGLDSARQIHEMVHFCDWLPTLLGAASVPVPPHLKIDGDNLLPVLRGEAGRPEIRRFWQWNRYTPLVTCNAAMRDGDWKLIRPMIREAMLSQEWLAEFLRWQDRAMYEPEYFIANGPIRDPLPRLEAPPPPPPPELYNVAQDPLERTDLADTYPDRVRVMLPQLEDWFDEVEAERATIDDVW